ncbi:ATP-binding protein [Actinoplanes sp. N902-109]|uniref:ATP-binding protein n=1 Tax=Actinoplanes sp. (strain N902-109) TaxID=649831 RepID=UPI0003A80B64|nr:ATP-binding protein [Actinoplanes sp. N902-109]
MTDDARAAAAELETGTTFDLTACVREPIHRLGGVQSYGSLVALDNDRIAVVSANAEVMLGVGPLLDRPVGCLLTAEQLATLIALADADTGQTAMMPVELQPTAPVGPAATAPAPDRARRFDVTVHRSEGLLVLEFEPAGPAVNEFAAFYAPIRQALVRLQRAGTVAEACQAAVREIRAITGYDRVVAYRFESFEGPGEVIAEEVIPQWEPWLGLWFPATDIPPQARRLYERNWIRVIADVDDATATLQPETGEPLDLSLSVLRTVSPFHLEYLRNIGVTSSMSVSLLANGRLWGLIACHGRDVKPLAPHLRAACEFFGVALSLHLAALRERDDTAAREESRTVIARLMERVAADLPTGWSAGPAGLERVVDCDAVAVQMDGRVVVHGADPGPEALAALRAALPPMRAGELWHSDELASGTPELAGALVARLTGTGDTIMWLRRERTSNRRWAADPDTPVVLGPHGKRLTPRGSTAVFLATVRGRSLPWTPTDLAMVAELSRGILEIAVVHARAMVALNTELSRSNVDLDSFAHAAAHDLKEPLRGIANTATFIAEDAADDLDPLTARRLGSIQRLATRMDELLNTLLYYSRLGRTELRRERLNLRDAVLHALEVAGPRLESAGVDIELPDPAQTISADPVLFDEVLVNLLVNAAKYASPDGSPRVAVGATADSVLFVRDNGVGMPPHLREEAFQLFRRLHPAAAPRDGSGAGLAIVRRIVERHGGRAWADETPGGGTTMWATFPASEA